MTALQACADEAKAWLFGRAAPRWAEHGWHTCGMFCERIDPRLSNDGCARRVMVQARQIYAYCELGRLGWDGPWRARAECAVEHLIRSGRRRDGFFVFSFTPDGTAGDARADLYTQAFVLFALGHATEVLRRPELARYASALADLIYREWHHPAGGFYEGEIDGPPRRQNPHMHLLEAASVQLGVSGDPIWATIAAEILTLAARHFIEPASGALTEYFEDDWKPVAGPNGRLAEPGHCLEWSWILETMPAGFETAAGLADGLVRFARAHGIDGGRGVTINAVDLDGAIVDGRARLWPQTERLKAALARLRRTGSPDEADEAVAAYRGLKKYLDNPAAGLWRDKLLADGTFLDEPAPASSFYHIVCGLAELIRTAAWLANHERPMSA